MEHAHQEMDRDGPPDDGPIWLPDEIEAAAVTSAPPSDTFDDSASADSALDEEVRAHGWTVDRVSPALGATIAGVDLSVADAGQLDTVGSLLLRHHVLFLPDQDLDVDQHLAVGRHFGPLASHPNLTNPFTPHDELFELAASTGGIADEWHTDLTFLAEPAVMSILRMVESPVVGGDTMWTNLHLAYEALSPPLRELVDGLSALHDAQPHGHPEQATIHPVVRRHPHTGRPALYVNEHFTRRIVELSAAESAALLPYLTRWVQDPRFTVRYRWSPGTVAIWDNRCTQHYVVNDFSGERVIQRVTVMGDRPEGAPPRWEPWIADRGAASRHDWAMRRQLRADAGGQAQRPSGGE